SFLFSTRCEQLASTRSASAIIGSHCRLYTIMLTCSFSDALEIRKASARLSAMRRLMPRVCLGEKNIIGSKNQPRSGRRHITESQSHMPDRPCIGPRISIRGATGSGKTTLGHILRQRLGLPVVELDAIYWLPNWQVKPLEQFRADVQAALEACPQGW